MEIKLITQLRANDEHGRTLFRFPFGYKTEHGTRMVVSAHGHNAEVAQQAAQVLLNSFGVKQKPVMLTDEQLYGGSDW